MSELECFDGKKVRFTYFALWRSFGRLDERPSSDGDGSGIASCSRWIDFSEA